MTDNQAARGRIEFVSIIAIGVAVFLGVGVAAWLRSGEVGGVGTFGRPIVLLALGMLAYGGRNWARTAATIWMAFISLVMLLSAIPVVGDHLAAGMFIFANGIVFGAAAFRLQTSAAIDAFLRERHGSASSIARAS